MDKPLVQIWMAEDNEADLLLMRAALDEQALHYELRAFRDGAEALQLVDTAGSTPHFDCPHLLILDLHLPNVDGREVLRRFRANANCINTPVLIFSSSIAPAQREFIDTFARIFVEEKPSELGEYMAVGGRIRSMLTLGARAP
jgi:CheY-like chemotaxis protein